MWDRLIKWFDGLSNLIKALTVIGAAMIGIWVGGIKPMVVWVETVSTTQTTIVEALDQYSQEVNALRAAIAERQRQEELDHAPVVSFATNGNMVTDGKIGGLVKFTVGLKVVRDCGQPRVTVVFRNGNQVVHRFENVSINSLENRAPSLIADGQMNTLRFVATIPDDEGVQATKDDLAHAWVEMDFPDQCRSVAPVKTAEMPFRITN